MMRVFLGTTILAVMATTISVNAMECNEYLKLSQEKAHIASELSTVAEDRIGAEVKYIWRFSDTALAESEYLYNEYTWCELGGAERKLKALDTFDRVEVVKSELAEVK